MEINRGRRNSSSCDMFSFPIPDSDQPGSPNSPADHLFFNGKLLPHYFPTQTVPSNFSYSRSTSRTSSISSSKDSLMSSRSNSTNSNCSSARTSTSEAASERKLVSSGTRERKKPGVSSGHYEYCYSQRWQLFAAAPVLKQQGLRSSRKAKFVDTKGNKKSCTRSWFGWKILNLFVSACQECHAIKT